MTTTDVELYVPPTKNVQPEPNVLDLHGKVVQQNLLMWQQLEVAGQRPNQVLLHDCALESLVDLLFNDEDSKEKFSFAVDARLNARLRAMLEQEASKLVVPE